VARGSCGTRGTEQMGKVKKKTVPKREVSSWSELRDVLEELASAGWAFRGQADASWPLESSLTRYLKTFGGPPNGWSARETKILHTFKRKAHLLLSRTPEESETLEWLALMQHHGAPTRLLDFTWSPYVAAFFALEKATADAAIWAISSGPSVPNYRGFYISALLDRVLGVQHPTMLAAEIQRKADEEKMPAALMGEPVLMNQRMTTQAGTFIIPTTRIDVPVESVVSRSSVLKVKLITKSLRKQTMDRLYNMNINNATLFPGVDGLARSLAFELEFKWTVDAAAARRLTRR
jgi:FRG domain